MAPPIKAAGLLDLPTEILHKIFDTRAFPTDTLYHIAVLSRRLRSIALPVYLSRNGMDLASNSATITMRIDRLDLLSRLQIALFISFMERITFILPHPSCTSIAPFLAQLKRVESFISRLSFVREVTLQLYSIEYSQCLSVGDDNILRTWTSRFGALLNSILQAKCTALTVVHGSYLTRSYELIPPGFFRKYFRAKDAAAFRHDLRQGKDTVSVPLPLSGASSHLTTLNIQSTTLIMPPGLNWTLGILRHASLTSLTLHMSALVEPLTWRIVLPQLASTAPHLMALSLLAISPPLRTRRLRIPRAPPPPHHARNHPPAARVNTPHTHRYPAQVIRGRNPPPAPPHAHFPHELR
ncbi:hypothetical protein C8R43DRAFT_1129212 [Mycena crocata]|nr:hypothetical protein C8R43DRAFT_1129212 [Mycena crocata]